MARPTDYNQTVAATICERLIEGESLRSVCRDPEMPALSSVMLWLTKHSEFTEQYAKATEERAAGMFEDMFDIADDVDVDPASVAKARLRVDTRKWALSKMLPKKYGDKITQEHTGTDGGPIRTQGTVDVTGLSAEQLAVLASIPVAGE